MPRAGAERKAPQPETGVPYVRWPMEVQSLLGPSVPAGERV